MRRCGSFGERFAISVAASSSAALSRCHSASSASLGGVVEASSVSPRPMRFAVRSRPSSTCSLAIAAALRVTDAVTNGLPSRSPPTHEPDPHERAHDRRAPACRRALQRVVDAAVDVRDRGVQRLVEDGHHGAHLVGGRGLLGAQRRRAPQRVDLLEHPPLGAALVGAVAQRRVVLLEERGQAPDARRDRAPPGLGGVSGEDGVEAQTPADAASAVSSPTSAARRTNAAATESVGILAIGTTVALAQDPHALVLLREVHEVEVAR